MGGKLLMNWTNSSNFSRRYVWNSFKVENPRGEFIKIRSISLKSMQEALKSISFKYLDGLRFLNTLLLRNCENVAAQRIRRIQQISFLYSKLWSVKNIQDVAKTFKGNIFGKKTFLLSASCLVSSYDWNKERIQDSEMRGYVNELDDVKQLIERTLKCRECSLRKWIDQAEPKLSYCKCQAKDQTNLEEWEPVYEKLNLIVWRKYKAGKLYEYKVHGIYPDISANAFLKVQLDCAFRKTWDDSALEMKELDYDPKSSSVVLHWKTKFPFPMSNREYVFKRRHYIDQHRQVMVIVNQATHHPKWKPSSDSTKVDVYWSVMVIKPLKTFDEVGIEFCVNYYDEPGTCLPNFLTNWVASSGLPGYMEKVRLAAKLIEANPPSDKIKLYGHEPIDYSIQEKFQGQRSYA